ncbi:MAG: hypothetical protein HY865_04605 [Chloroflexi bacterium]|nr:hypothetical protein [Chloroflexota bacterium]
MKKLLPSTDLLWFLLAALLVLAFASIPFWVGRASETEDLRFRGTYFDETDYAVHLSMMQAGRMGDWVYQMRFTNEEHRPAYLRMFYIVLGHVSKWIGLDVESTFHLARWVFGFAALYAIYRLLCKIFPNSNHARAPFLLAALGAGAGWLQLLLGAPLEPISPIDFWLIDAYVFFSISLFPSFSFTLALMAWALNLFLDYLETGKPQTIFLVSLLAILSQTTNPISFAVVDMAFAGAVLALWWNNKKIEARHIVALAVIALAQIPLLVYNYLVLSRDPFWRQFTAQNQTLSPPPMFYLWGFAPFWLFALYGVFIALGERNPKLLALTAWTVGGFALAYLPVAIQRRFILGITIPLAALAIHGLSNLLKRIPILMKRENVVYFSYILLASISSIYLSLGLSLFLRTLPEGKFYPRDVESALVWLNENAVPNDFVLADVPTSQLVAQRTRLKVYVGHEMETLGYEDKLREMELFFNGEMPDGWLAETQVKWVIANKDDDLNTTGLEAVYENGSAAVYRVASE